MDQVHEQHAAAWLDRLFAQAIEERVADNRAAGYLFDLGRVILLDRPFPCACNTEVRVVATPRKFADNPQFWTPFRSVMYSLKQALHEVALLGILGQPRRYSANQAGLLARYCDEQDIPWLVLAAEEHLPETPIEREAPIVLRKKAQSYSIRLKNGLPDSFYALKPLHTK